MKAASYQVPFSPDDVKSVFGGQADSRTIRAVLTSQTCGENCWHAREEICRCSCGGVNHGCLLVAGAKQPIRASRIDGAMYELVEVGVMPHEIDTRLKTDYAPAAIISEPMEHYADKDLPGKKRVFWTYQSHGSPLRCKVATKEQIAHWPELTAYRNLKPYEQRPYLLWRLKA